VAGLKQICRCYVVLHRRFSEGGAATSKSRRKENPAAFLPPGKIPHA
jgi:hypothetical protein